MAALNVLGIAYGVIISLRGIIKFTGENMAGHPMLFAELLDMRLYLLIGMAKCERWTIY